MLFAVLVFAAALVTSHGAKLPSNWIACKLSDPKMTNCIKKAIGIALNDFASGAPVIEGETLDPLHFEQITIAQGNGPISINLNFKGADFHGIKNAKIGQVQGNWKKMDVQFNVPLVRLTDKFRGTAHFKFQEKTIGKKKYYQVQNLDVDWETDKFEIFFKNLFNGDKVLGDNMNKFLNENAKEILSELKPSITKAFALSFTSVANRLLSKFPKDEVSPP